MITKTKKENKTVEIKPEVMNWYAIRVQNNKERFVLERLNIELKLSNMLDRLGRTIIPTEKTVNVKNGKKIMKDKIIFPGYIFIETNAKGEISNILKTIHGASGFVKTKSGEILPMKEYEVKKIITDQETNDNIDYDSVFTLNEMVEVIDGPFSTFKGKIVRIEPEKQKVGIEVSIFGRVSTVDLSLNQIKKT